MVGWVKVDDAHGEWTWCFQVNQFHWDVDNLFKPSTALKGERFWWTEFSHGETSQRLLPWVCKSPKSPFESGLAPDYLSNCRHKVSDIGESQND